MTGKVKRRMGESDRRLDLTGPRLSATQSGRQSKAPLRCLAKDEAERPVDGFVAKH